MCIQSRDIMSVINITNILYHPNKFLYFIFYNRLMLTFYKLFYKGHYFEIKIRDKQDLKNITLNRRYDLGFHKMNFTLKTKFSAKKTSFFKEFRFVNFILWKTFGTVFSKKCCYHTVLFSCCHFYIRSTCFLEHWSKDNKRKTKMQLQRTGNWN